MRNNNIHAQCMLSIPAHDHILSDQQKLLHWPKGVPGIQAVTRGRGGGDGLGVLKKI